ncbi:MAG: GNAT family N-acetyltransferase [Deltaproteobacteria bacterium]|nr:GNAT family N-acetyltransferase [Deltaproteobacteria bacterium]
METKIRHATKADRSLMVAYHHALYVDHRQAIVAKDLAPLYAYKNLPTALRDDVDAILSSPRSVALVAEEDGEPVGYITGHIEDDQRRELSRKGVVEDWFVEVEARKRGVGRALFDALVAAFRERGCVMLESTTWAGNAGARAAHQALGFHDIEIKMRRKI